MNTKKAQISGDETWRTTLGTLIQMRHKREQIANTLGVNPFTLRRWANNESSPQPRTLQKLFSFFSEQDTYLAPLLTQEFSPRVLLSEPHSDPVDDISVAFYRQVLTLRASLPSPQDIWHLRELILWHALDQLDYGRHDTMAMLALCTPPATANRVRSLRGVQCMGYPPLGSSLDLKPYFGAESLIGYTLTSGHPSIIHDTHEETRIPLPRMSEHRSILVFPLRCGNQFAGTFTLASCTPYAFLSSSQLGEKYASLLSVTCTREALYDPQDIALATMPALSIQEPYLFRFLHFLKQVYQNQENIDPPLSPILAEQLVWQQIEAELIQQTRSEYSGDTSRG